jgi:recombination protein RecR
MSIRHSSAAIENLVAEFSRLPGIGRRTAQRMVMSIVKYSKCFFINWAESLMVVAVLVRICSICSNPT